MAEQTDILGTLKSSLGVAGKLAGRSFTGVSGLMKSDESSGKGQSGVYWSRGPWSNENGLVPLLDFNESQDAGRYKVSIVKRVTTSKAERSFIQACGCCLDGDRLEEAKNGLQEVVESDPQYADGYFMLGCIALEQQHYEEAAAHFQKATLCQQGLGVKLKKHLPSFRMILRLSPSSVLALYPEPVGLNVLAALTQRQLGQSQAALTSLQQVLEVMPNEPLMLFFMAILRLECAQYAQLVEELCEVLPASTLQVASLLLVGCACAKLGDVATAGAVYRKALESSDYDSLLRLDLQCALADCQGGAGNGDVERIKQEYPGYQPFLQRLGIAVGSRVVTPQAQVGFGAASAPAGYGVPASPTASAPAGAPAGCGVPASPTASAPAGAPAGYGVPASPTASNPAGAPAGYSVPASPTAPDWSAVVPPLVPTSAPSVSSAPGVPSAAVTPSLPTAGLSQNAHATAVPLPFVDATAPVPNMPARAAVSVVEPLPPRQEGVVKLVCAERQLEFVLGQQPFTVGRDEGDAALSFDQAVSRQHARIVCVNGHYQVEDLHSTNGTWLNGYRLSGGYRYEINRGDTVQFGLTRFRLI